ncbi:3-deoxy-manno-octulosonate cytidylyltransferase [Celerinatantimonas sp. MCCC 1A17872]|uniref:3-deoxy-manno-octulosonate cytidylyltransferase n=1 Tax=Celerinatantimonas sp. MCCC 1A17872 TaxID=3177514 RepID=UPI0038BEA7B3
MSYTIVIPARYASTRLPGKPLLDIAGKPMIQRVYEQALKTQAQTVVVATDDERIEQCVLDFGGKVCLTAKTHESGTERLAEVVTTLNLSDDEVVVNIQGDEPLIPPQIVDQVANLLLGDTQAPMATLGAPITEHESIMDPNVVKVVCNKKGQAIYFSRAPIPYSREGSWPLNDYLRHIGIYAYRAGFIRHYVTLSPSPLELSEKLEQLRVLWHGYAINVAKALIEPGVGVDTAEDLEKVRKIILSQSQHC